MDFKSLGKGFSDLGAQITPFASRTFQFTKEQLGQADDKTELPPDYIDLEKRVDALKQAHQKMLAVTSQYSTEAYDYPPNIKETFQDLGRTVSEKVTLLSSATSPAEAQAALVAPLPPSRSPRPSATPLLVPVWLAASCCTRTTRAPERILLPLLWRSMRSPLSVLASPALRRILRSRAASLLAGTPP
ncbi:hypothetical protein V2G26_014701 [Clonostachys chloroleuca]